MLSSGAQTSGSTLYRGFRSKQESLHVPRLNTWRVPTNVPYVVDNLWEWARPEGYPSRRAAAYASPSIEEVKANGRIFVYRLKLPAGSVVAQLEGIADSTFHTEVVELRGLLIKALGADWFSKELPLKGNEALLYCPCLHKDDVESIVSNSSILSSIGLREKIRYWSNIRLLNIDEAPLALSGEVFVTVPVDGYYLEQVE